MLPVVPFLFMIFLGIDPDLHSTAWCMLDDEGVVESLWLTKVSAKFKGAAAVVEMARHLHGTEMAGVCCTAAAIEGQQHYLGKQKNPKSIQDLGQVTGACLVCIRSENVSIPLPKHWKQQQPKRVNQPRSYKQLGWEYEITTHRKPDDRYAVPTSGPYIGMFNKGEWKHLGDAIGLALYARKKYLGAKK